MNRLSSAVGRFFVFAKDRLRFSAGKMNDSAETLRNEPVNSLRSEDYVPHETEGGMIFVSRPTEAVYLDEEEFRPAIMSVVNTSLMDANASSGNAVRFEEPTEEFVNATPRSARAEIDYSVFTVRTPVQTAPAVTPVVEDIFVARDVVPVEPSASTVTSAEVEIPAIPEPEMPVEAEIPAAVAESAVLPVVEAAPVEEPAVEIPAEVPVVEAVVEEPVVEVVAEPVVETPAAEVSVAEPVMEVETPAVEAVEIPAEPVVEVVAEPVIETPAAEVSVAEPVMEVEADIEPAVEIPAEVPVVEAAPVEAASEDVVEIEVTPAEEIEASLSGFAGGVPVAGGSNLAYTADAAVETPAAISIGSEENAMFYLGVGRDLKIDVEEIDSVPDAVELPARDSFLEEECFKKVVEEEIAENGVPAELPTVQLPEAPAPVMEAVVEAPVEPAVEVVPVEPVVEAPAPVMEAVVEAPVEPVVVAAPVEQKRARVLSRKSVRPEDVAAILFN